METSKHLLIYLTSIQYPVPLTPHSHHHRVYYNICVVCYLYTEPTKNQQEKRLLAEPVRQVPLAPAVHYTSTSCILSSTGTSTGESQPPYSLHTPYIYDTQLYPVTLSAYISSSLYSILQCYLLFS